MNYFMNASCLVVHLFHSAVTELLLEARDYIQGHADAYDCSNEEQNHHDPNCATLTNGLGHAANDEGQEYRCEAHEGVVHTNVTTTRTGAHHLTKCNAPSEACRQQRRSRALQLPRTQRLHQG